jgi:putative acetyltransferase
VRVQQQADARVSITDAVKPEEIATARELFQEYADALGFDLCFQGFGQELATLPGSYARPGGCLLLASVGSEIAGCAALRPLEPGICEMKRLYVRPAFRGYGVGRLLVNRIVAEARTAGYQRLRLDTLPTMVSALSLYRQLGFHDIPAYRQNPEADVVYLELELDRVSLES